ncbi:MAG: heme exporter protein CcmD [Xanthobacteraceae bacterium]
MNLGTHAGFIIAAYAVALAVVVALIGWIIADYRTQRRALAELEIAADEAPARRLR